PEWFDALGPGWQQRWLENFATLQTGGFADEDLVHDGWTDISQRIRDRVVAEIGSGKPFGPDDFLRAYQESDDEKMEEIRARVDAIVHDPVTAAALKPWYRQLCKRPCFHDEYLQTYNRPNVHLVDTDGMGVQQINERGVVVGGREYQLDCLVFASGFEVGTTWERRAGFDPAGRDGRRLSAHWADGMRSKHGLHVHGFPNLFVVSPSQGANLISNVTHNFSPAGAAIAGVVRHAIDSGNGVAEVTAEAEEAWVQLLEGSQRSFRADPDCTPGYYNNEGRPTGRREKLNGAGYPEGPVAYFRYIDEWTRAGTFEGLDFTPGPDAAPDEGPASTAAPATSS
ncbi:MAG: hypothetical protein RI900_1874, partial [Actinomycetota bacterium]